MRSRPAIGMIFRPDEGESGAQSPAPGDGWQTLTAGAAVTVKSVDPARIPAQNVTIS